MDQVYKDRLLLLADFLDKLPPEKFDFSRWGSLDWKDGECGTTACALGWATTIPEFRELGLRMWTSRRSAPEPCLLRELPYYDLEEHTATRAACEIFGLDEDQFAWLFMPGMFSDEISAGRLSPDATAKRVSEHIRQFVAAH